MMGQKGDRWSRASYLTRPAPERSRERIRARRWNSSMRKGCVTGCVESARKQIGMEPAATPPVSGP